MVVDGDGEDALGVILTDDVVVQEIADLHRLGQLVELDFAVLGELFLDNLVAQVDALITDVHAGAGDELLHLLLTLPAERAFQQVATVSDSRHRFLPTSLLIRCGTDAHLRTATMSSVTAGTPTVPASETDFELLGANVAT